MSLYLRLFFFTKVMEAEQTFVGTKMETALVWSLDLAVLLRYYSSYHEPYSRWSGRNMTGRA